VNICSGRFWITDTAWAQTTDMGTHISVYVYLSQTDSTKGKWGSIEREDLSPFFKARANRYSDREWQDQLKSLCCRIWQGVEELKNRLDLDKYPHHRVYPEFEVVPLILRSTHQPLNLSRSDNESTTSMLVEYEPSDEHETPSEEAQVSGAERNMGEDMAERETTGEGMAQRGSSTTSILVEYEPSDERDTLGRGPSQWRGTEHGRRYGGKGDDRRRHGATGKFRQPSTCCAQSFPAR
jgi:hypothetical protein